MKYYYGIEYWDNAKTTMGSPNDLTGWYSIACSIKAFTSQDSLNKWLDQGSKRHKIGKSKLRSLCLGMSMCWYWEKLNHIELMAN